MNRKKTQVKNSELEKRETDLLEFEKKMLKAYGDDTPEELTELDRLEKLVEEARSLLQPVEDTFNPICMHFRTLQSYSDFFSLEEILMFEFMVMLNHQFKNKPFFQQLKRIQSATKLNRTKVENAIKKLKDLGILSITKGSVNKNYYQVNFEVVISLIDKIYDFKRANLPVSEEYAKSKYDKFFNELSSLS